MRNTIITLAAVLLLAGGSDAALGQTRASSYINAQSGQSPARSPSTVSPAEPAAQNPLVNPDAAGTQMGWRGYGATSDATAEHRVGSGNTGRHLGLDDPGSVTPGAGMNLGSGTASPPVGRAETAGEARERLKQLGYSRITELRRVGRSGWQAVAQHGKRPVRVQLSDSGTLVSER